MCRIEGVRVGLTQEVRVGTLGGLMELPSKRRFVVRKVKGLSIQGLRLSKVSWFEGVIVGFGLVLLRL